MSLTLNFRLVCHNFVFLPHTYDFWLNFDLLSCSFDLVCHNFITWLKFFCGVNGPWYVRVLTALCLQAQRRDWWAAERQTGRWERDGWGFHSCGWAEVENQPAGKGQTGFHFQTQWRGTNKHLLCLWQVLKHVIRKYCIPQCTWLDHPLPVWWII